MSTHRLAAALEAAADGDVLTVAPGTYRENLVVERAVTLRGPEGSPGSVRIAPVDGVPLTVRASAVVQDLHVEGQDSAAARAAGRGRHPGADWTCGSSRGPRPASRCAAAPGPTVRRCTVDNPAGIGIAVLDGGGRGVRGVRGRRGRAVRRRGARRRPTRAWSAAGSTTPRARACRLTGEGTALEAVGCEVYEVRGSGVQVTARATGASHRLRGAPHDGRRRHAGHGRRADARRLPTSTTSRRTRSTCARVRCSR